jgi:hypothetical protein
MISDTQRADLPSQAVSKGTGLTMPARLSGTRDSETKSTYWRSDGSNSKAGDLGRYAGGDGLAPQRLNDASAPGWVRGERSDAQYCGAGCRSRAAHARKTSPTPRAD